MKKRIFKVGDTVKVINPQEFIRCGYPLSYQEAEEYIENNHTDKIFNIFKAIRGADQSTDNYDVFADYDRHQYTKAYRRVVEGLALEYLEYKNYGGKIRSVHSKYNNELEKVIAKVTAVKVCQSGKYVSACQGGSYGLYEGEYEYSPPYLTEVKMHRILHCSVIPTNNSSFIHLLYQSQFRIEDINVELVKEEV